MDATSEIVECFYRQHEIKIILFTSLIDVPGLIVHDLSVHVAVEKNSIFKILKNSNDFYHLSRLSAIQ